MLRHLLSSFSLAVLLYSHVGGAEKTWLSKFPKFPEAKSLEVVHFVTVKKESTPTMFVSGPVQLVDAKTNARIFDASQMKGLGLAVLSHSQLVKLSDTGVSFCDKDGAFTLGDAYSWTLADLEGASASKVYKPVSSGLYYVVQTNCAEKNLPFKFSAGELSTTSVAGWLPGEESPKLAFYFYLLVAYVGLLAVWGVWCKSWADVLFNIHHYITVAILAGLLEAACWYISLFHWNFLGHRWWSMMALASFGTVAKQGLCYGVLLLACLGLGVTKPRLEGKTLIRVMGLVIAFIVSDGIRQMALMTQNRINDEYEAWKILLFVTPGSFFVSVIYVWILSALQETITDLNEKRQLVKVEVYQSLRLALMLVVGVTVALVAYETIVVRRTELAANWESRFIFTDVLSHCCFFFLLMVIMMLWRPSERSLQMAYSQQLESTDKEIAGIQMGQVSEDFQSVEVEIGDDPAESGDFDFKKSMEENSPSDSKKPQTVLE